jgi:hypothetical protein
MTNRQPFPIVVTGSDTFTDAARVEATLSRLLSRRRFTQNVCLVCGPEPPGRIAARWGEANGLPVEDMEDADPRNHGVFRNAKLLNSVFAYVAFRTAERWSEDVEDLITRAKSIHRAVRIIEG